MSYRIKSPYGPLHVCPDDRQYWRGKDTVIAITEAERNARRAVADEVSDALGDFERLPADVAERMTALLHRLRTGREP